MYKCAFCSNTFSRQSTLTKHQNTANYCRTLRLDHELALLKGNGKSNNTPTPRLDTNTTINIATASISTLNDNSSGTVGVSVGTGSGPNVAVELEKTKNELQQIRELISNINNAPKNPVVQNMEPVSVAHIEAMALEHLDIADIERGLEGIVDFTVKYPLQGRVICTDKSRRKFKYTDENGNMVNDYGGTKLSQTIFEGIEKRCVELIDQKYAILADSIRIAVENNKGYEESVLENMKQSTRLQDLKNDLMDAAQGNENELQKSYIRKLVGRY